MKSVTPNSPRVYFRKLTLQNVRSFGEQPVSLDFLNKEGKPSMWNVIVGDNGTGKTTVLKCLNIIQDDSFDTFRDKAKYFNRGQDKGAKFTCILDSYFHTSSGPKWEQVPVKIDLIEKNLRSAWPFERNPRYHLHIFAYGASRRIGISGLSTGKNESPNSLINENAELTNPEEWLVRTDYAAIKNPELRPRYNKVVEILKKLFGGEIEDIKIEGYDPAKVLFKTQFGWVDLHNLSLGQKTLIAWMVDFAKGLFDLYPSVENPLEMPAICLVDEIDLHLHPKFQQRLMDFLSSTFPGTQFIVTAHSPLVVQAAIGANLILLEKEGDHIRVNNEPEMVEDWRVDQLLTSDLFGLKTARAPRTQELIDEQEKLLGKTKRNKKEEARLEELNQRLSDLPMYSSPLEKQAYSAVDKIIEILKQKEASDQNK
ncbi:MAG: AAA family ATPase [Bacteroidia bacterium]|nr:AAA family ATPase [Bacteroidia bacterium]